MGSDGCAAGRGATPSELVWVLAPVIAIVGAMALFGLRRFGLVGGKAPAVDRRPEALIADLVVSHPLKVCFFNAWLIAALSVSAFVDVGCGELRESIDVLLDVDAYTKADNRASEWFASFEAAKSDTRYCASGTSRRLSSSSGGRIDKLTLIYLRKPLRHDVIKSPVLYDAQKLEKELLLTVFGTGWRDHCLPTYWNSTASPRNCAPWARDSSVPYFWTGSGLTTDSELRDVDQVTTWLAQTGVGSAFFSANFGTVRPASEIMRSTFTFLVTDESSFKAWLVDHVWPKILQSSETSSSSMRLLWLQGDINDAEVASALGLDMVLCVLALVLVFAALIAHMHSPVLAIVAMGQVLVSIPVAQYFYLRVFDVYVIYLLNFLSVFIVAGIGADDAFLFFDTLAQTMVERQHKKDGLRRVTALHDCKGDRKDELSFKKGDVLIVEDEAGDGWWRGRLSVGVGKFPATYVVECAEPRRVTAIVDRSPRYRNEEDELFFQAGDLIRVDDDSGEVWRGSLETTGISGRFPAASVMGGKRYKAKFDCDADAADELGFYEGDILEVSDQSDPDWWIGSLVHAKGVFPATHVEHVEEAFDKVGRHALAEAYRRAGASMATTSITSAAAFYALGVSELPAIQAFGIFTGTLIMVNFVLVVSVFPAVLVLCPRSLRAGRPKPAVLAIADAENATFEPDRPQNDVRNPLARGRLGQFLERPAVKYVTSSLHAAQEKIGRGLDRVSEVIAPSSKRGKFLDRDRAGGSRWRQTLQQEIDTSKMGFLDRFFGVTLPGVLLKRAGLIVVLTLILLLAAAVSIGLVAFVSAEAPRFFRRDHNLGLVYQVRDKYFPADGGVATLLGEAAGDENYEYGSATQRGTGGYDDTQWSPQCADTVGTNGEVCSGNGRCAHATGRCTCNEPWLGLRCDSEDETLTLPPVSSPPTVTPRPTPVPVPTVTFVAAGDDDQSPNAVAGPPATPAPAAGAAPGSPALGSGDIVAPACVDETCGRCSCSSNGCQTADGACDCFPDYQGERCEVYYPYDLQHTITLDVVQGVRRRPGGRSDAHPHGRPRYWRLYDWSDPNVQTYARDACDEHAKHPHLKMRREDSACIVELFEASWLKAQDKALPLTPNEFEAEFLAYVDSNPTAGLGGDSILDYVGVDCSADGVRTVRWMRDRILLDVRPDASLKTRAEVYRNWVRHLRNRDHGKPRGATRSVLSSDNYVLTALLDGVIRDTLIGAAVALACAFLCVLVASGSLGHTTLVFALVVAECLVLTFTVTCLLGYPIGIIEAVSMPIFLGLSIDYSFHVDHAYRLAAHDNPNTEPERLVRRALETVGAPVAAAAVTTFSSTFILIFARLLPFSRIGVIASVNTTFAALTALVVLPSCLHLLTCLRREQGCWQRQRPKLQKLARRSRSLLRSLSPAPRPRTRPADLEMKLVSITPGV